MTKQDDEREQFVKTLVMNGPRMTINDRLDYYAALAWLWEKHKECRSEIWKSHRESDVWKQCAKDLRDRVMRSTELGQTMHEIFDEAENKSDNVWRS